MASFSERGRDLCREVCVVRPLAVDPISIGRCSGLETPSVSSGIWVPAGIDGDMGDHFVANGVIVQIVPLGWCCDGKGLSFGWFAFSPLQMAIGVGAVFIDVPNAIGIWKGVRLNARVCLPERDES